MKTSLFKYLILPIIIVGSLIIGVDEAIACGSVSLYATPTYFQCDRYTTSYIRAYVTAPDGTAANGKITFTIRSSPSSSDKFSSTTVPVSSGVANAVFRHYSSGPGTIHIFASAEIEVDAGDGNVLKYYPTGTIDLYALKVELVNPVKYIAVGDTVIYTAKITPDIKGKCNWKITQGADKAQIASYSDTAATVKGVAASKNVNDVTLNVVFRPDGAGQNDWIRPINYKFSVISIELTPAELDIGTDGKVETKYAGEIKNMIVDIKPSNFKVEFNISDSDQAVISSKMGSGKITLKVTSKGENDTQINILKDNYLLKSTVVRLHKPKRMEFDHVNDIPLPPKTYGDKKQRFYKIYDDKDREVNIKGYYAQEYVTMIENDNGQGKPYKNVVKATKGPHPNVDLVDTLEFTWLEKEGMLEAGHKYKWNQRFQILGLNIENNQWKHDYRRIDGTHLEIYTNQGQW